jgi:hypothetical protein
MCDAAPSPAASPQSTPGKDVDAVEASALAAAAATIVLRRAAHGRGGRRPAASTVSFALLQLERQQRRNKAVTDVAELAGQWELVVTSSPKKKDMFSKPMYFPLCARQTFIPAESGPQTGVFDNAVFFCGSQLRFRGPYRWIAGRANRVEFTFSSLSMKLGPFGPFVFDNIDKEGSELGTRTAKVLPFFTFYMARNGIAAARGRAGGIALYRRVPSGQEL